MPNVSEEDISKLKKSLPINLGLAIKMARKKNKLSQTELATLTLKDRQYIYKIEQGKVTPNIVTIGIIAKALNLSIPELLENL
ncbi:MAG TPA: helix-turn-helix transcriptional regulator [Aequorivita sp.]|jgi:transcriptional regulator with XRE-family HTH domain|nr:transcriptional regulator [Aequorivita sp.]MBP42072.1 transcriptional regulator [Aequorivita sp.]HBC04539.1 transcriptional regulator [Aequorivita sp.]HNP68335.1 helix-turn-helix transcriptional regulator [Aequorivita sp.]|tara:strand:+ start:2395 stop:2643 length:249 start_codon:yes stop_codon:yes gene_type:complete